MISILIEAALRALVVALTVGTGLRLFRVSNVLAQKAAWGLVLAAAVAMPLMMRWQVLPAPVTVRVPVALWPMTTGSLPIRDALLLSSDAKGLVAAPQAKPFPARRLSKVAHIRCLARLLGRLAR